jgi:prevent-host-death family protein
MYITRIALQIDATTGQKYNRARSYEWREDMTDWQLQDAKNRFSAVVDAALSGFPQRVTRRGKPAVVVLSVDEYERLCQLERAQGNSSDLVS